MTMLPPGGGSKPWGFCLLVLLLFAPPSACGACLHFHFYPEMLAPFPRQGTHHTRFLAFFTFPFGFTGSFFTPSGFELTALLLAGFEVPLHT